MDAAADGHFFRFCAFIKTRSHHRICSFSPRRHKTVALCPSTPTGLVLQTHFVVERATFGVSRHNSLQERIRRNLVSGVYEQAYPKRLNIDIFLFLTFLYCCWKMEIFWGSSSLLCNIFSLIIRATLIFQTECYSLSKVLATMTCVTDKERNYTSRLHIVKPRGVVLLATILSSTTTKNWG